MGNIDLTASGEDATVTYAGENMLSSYTELLRAIQLSSSPGGSRNVSRTINSQLIIASKNREMKNGVSDTFQSADVSTYKKLPISTSAKDLPPALAACEGLGSSPFRIYK